MHGETARAVEQFEQVLHRLGRPVNPLNAVQYADGAQKTFAEHNYVDLVHRRDIQDALEARARSPGRHPILPASPMEHTTADDPYTFESTVSAASPTVMPARAWRVVESPSSPSMATSPSGRVVHVPQPDSSEFGYTSPSRHSAYHHTKLPQSFYSAQYSSPRTASRPSPPPRHETQLQQLTYELSYRPIRAISPSMRSPASGMSLTRTSSALSLDSPRRRISLEERTERVVDRLEAEVQLRLEAYASMCMQATQMSADNAHGPLDYELDRGARAEEAARRSKSIRVKLAAVRAAERELLVDVVAAESYLEASC